MIDCQTASVEDCSDLSTSEFLHSSQLQHEMTDLAFAHLPVESFVHHCLVFTSNDLEQIRYLRCFQSG